MIGNISVDIVPVECYHILSSNKIFTTGFLGKIQGKKCAVFGTPSLGKIFEKILLPGGIL